jgi:PAS domain S-box-containing protein
MTRLYIIEGPNKGDSHDLTREEYYIGRGPDNHIRIRDRSISGRHLRLFRKDNLFFLEDLKSTNGTFVNGVMIAPNQEVEVKEGNPIGLGNSLICLDREFTMGGTLVHHAVRFPVRSHEKRAVSLEDRPLTNPRHLQLIYNVSNILMQSLDLNEILDKVMDYLFDCMQRIDRGAILLLNHQTGELSETIARSRSGGKGPFIEYSRTIVNRVIQDGKAIIMSDTNRESDADLSDSIKELKIRSVMCVPLISRSEIRGVIYVDSLQIPNGFRKEDLLLLTGLSSPSAMAIENALLYGHMEKLVESRTASLRQTEKRLRKSEARFRAIFDNMHSGVIVYETDPDDDLIVVDFNQAAERIEGIGKEKAIGAKAFYLFPSHKDIGLMEAFERVRKTGKPETLPPCFYQDERISGWREYSLYRLPSGEIVNIYNDISARKRAEEAQRALQRKLFSSQKLESLGRLAGGVAHNFRNILQAILGNVEYLELIHGEEPEVGETARNINNSVNKGVDLVNSLLHFSKQGEAFEPVVLDLAEVVRETHALIDRLFDKRIEVKLNLQKGLFIRGNRSLLSQVFMNLFANARDAMPDGGRLLVEVRKNGKDAVALVSDTGHGMDKKVIGKIFEPFFTAKEVGKGTGLGLSTVHGIVEEHKGRITVRSQPGKGATFKIFFPLSEFRESPSSEPAKQIIYGHGQRVMIVDDDQNALHALAGLARGLGYLVHAVSRAAEALGEYERWRPDVVVMDRSMPEMDGVSCIREIMKRDRDAKVVIVSGYEQFGPHGLDDPIKEVIQGYITKPCGLEELSRTLSRVLEGEKESR